MPTCICQEMFLFLHRISRTRLYNLILTLTNGIVPRTHGNKGKMPQHSMKFHEITRVIDFIKCYANVHAIPLPGCLPKHQDYRIMKLPSDVSKATVYHSYVTASETLQTDITCPQPESNSETDQLAAIVEESNSPPTKRARLCSHCRRPGHSSWKDHVSCTFVMISSLHCNYLVCIIVFLVLF